MSGLVFWVLLVGDSGVSFGVERPVGSFKVYFFKVYKKKITKIEKANKKMYKKKKSVS